MRLGLPPPRQALPPTACRIRRTHRRAAFPTAARTALRTALRAWSPSPFGAATVGDDRCPPVRRPSNALVGAAGGAARALHPSDAAGITVDSARRASAAQGSFGVHGTVHGARRRRRNVPLRRHRRPGQPEQTQGCRQRSGEQSGLRQRSPSRQTFVQRRLKTLPGRTVFMPLRSGSRRIGLQQRRRGSVTLDQAARIFRRAHPASLVRGCS